MEAGGFVVSPLTLFIYELTAVLNVRLLRQAYSGTRTTQFEITSTSSNTSWYLRLMALSCVDLFTSIPFLIYFTVLSGQSMERWISWRDTKSGKPWCSSFCFPSMFFSMPLVQVSLGSGYTHPSNGDSIPYASEKRR